MKITKKRLLKRGFEEETKNYLRFNDPKNSLLVDFDNNGNFESIRLFTHSKTQIGAPADMFPDYETLKTWCEVERGLVLPEVPKKRSLKKAVKGLKKMIDVNSQSIQSLMVENSDQHQRIFYLEGKSKHVNPIEAESPTSAENAQVEKPIEFGCWVEVVQGDEMTPIGEIGVFYYEREGRAFFITKNAIEIHTPIQNLKRIKSPIE